MKAQEEKPPQATITFRLSAQEKAEIEAQAQESGLTISEYIRRRIFGYKVIQRLPKTDEKTVEYLRKIGGLLKQIYVEKLVDKSVTWQVINQLKTCISFITKEG